jgi:hypothetical protein
MTTRQPKVHTQLGAGRPTLRFLKGGIPRSSLLGISR